MILSYPIRNLNRRNSALRRLLVSVEFTSDETSRTAGRQRFILNRRNSALRRLLVSVEFTFDEISRTAGRQRFILLQHRR